MSAMTVVAENEPTASDAPSPVAKSEAAAPPPATKPPAVAAGAAEPAAKPPAAAASKPQAKPAKSSGSNGGGTRRQGLNGKVKSMREPTKPSVSERLGRSHSTIEPGMTDSQATAARIRKEEEAEAAEHGTFQPQKASSMTRSGSTASAPPNSAPFGAPLLPTPNRPSVSTVRREQEDLDQRESEAEKRCTFKPKISESQLPSNYKPASSQTRPYPTKYREEPGMQSRPRTRKLPASTSKQLADKREAPKKKGYWARRKAMKEERKTAREAAKKEVASKKV